MNAILTEKSQQTLDLKIQEVVQTDQERRYHGFLAKWALIITINSNLLNKNV